MDIRIFGSGSDKNLSGFEFVWVEKFWIYKDTYKDTYSVSDRIWIRIGSVQQDLYL